MLKQVQHCERLVATGCGRSILPVPQAWGGGPPPQAVVEGRRRCVIAPPSALRAATSPWLRHREDLAAASHPHPDIITSGLALFRNHGFRP